jgi:hypothetical protein
VAVGEADVVGVAVGLGEDTAAAGVEGETLGLLPPPHPASSMDAASGTASIATEVLFTARTWPGFPLTVSPTS